jgi:hypothetical protein
MIDDLDVFSMEEQYVCVARFQHGELSVRYKGLENDHLSKSTDRLRQACTSA